MSTSQIKALVIDDERANRLYLKGILRKKFQVTVIEASNGMEGLKLIDKESPDFVLLDINMPVLNGAEVLTAIRGDKNHTDLPVIVLTAEKTQSTFKELIALGISDYLLKPIDFEFAIKRFSRFLKELRDSKASSAGNTLRSAGLEDNRLLIVDPDENFTTYFTNLLGKRFGVLVAGNGADGLEMYIKHRPKYTFVGENLPLLNETLLAKKIRALSGQAKILRLCATENESNVDIEGFSGALPKSFVPDAFLAKLNEIAFSDKKISTGYRDIIRNRMPSEMFKAVNQTFGIMASSDVTILEEKKSGTISKDVIAITPLVNTEEKIHLSIGLTCSLADAQWLTQKILGVETPSRTECTEVLEETVHTVTGRIRTAFESHGILLEERHSSVSFTSENQGESPEDLTLAFQCENSRLFKVWLGVDPQQAENPSENS